MRAAPSMSTLSMGDVVCGLSKHQTAGVSFGDYTASELGARLSGPDAGSLRLGSPEVTAAGVIVTAKPTTLGTFSATIELFDKGAAEPAPTLTSAAVSWQGVPPYLPVASASITAVVGATVTPKVSFTPREGVSGATLASSTSGAAPTGLSCTPGTNCLDFSYTPTTEGASSGTYSVTATVNGVTTDVGTLTVTLTAEAPVDVAFGVDDDDSGGAAASREPEGTEISSSDPSNFTRLFLEVPTPESRLSMGAYNRMGLAGYSASTQAGVWMSAYESGTFTARSNGQILFQSMEDRVVVLAKKSVTTLADTAVCVGGKGGIKIFAGIGTPEVEENAADAEITGDEALKEHYESAETWSSIWEGFDSILAGASGIYEAYKFIRSRNTSCKSACIASAANVVGFLAGVSTVVVNSLSIAGKVPVLNLHANSGINFGTISYASFFGGAGFVNFGSFVSIWGGLTAGVVGFGTAEISSFRTASVASILGDTSVAAPKKVEAAAQKKATLRGVTTQLGSGIQSCKSQLPTREVALSANRKVEFETTLPAASEISLTASDEMSLKSQKRQKIESKLKVKLMVGTNSVEVTPTGITIISGINRVEMNAAGIKMTCGPSIAEITSSRATLKSGSGSFSAVAGNGRASWTGSILTCG